MTQQAFAQTFETTLLHRYLLPSASSFDSLFSIVACVESLVKHLMGIDDTYSHFFFRSLYQTFVEIYPTK